MHQEFLKFVEESEKRRAQWQSELRECYETESRARIEQETREHAQLFAARSKRG